MITQFFYENLFLMLDQYPWVLFNIIHIVTASHTFRDKMVFFRGDQNGCLFKAYISQKEWGYFK